MSTPPLSLLLLVTALCTARAVHFSDVSRRVGLDRRQGRQIKYGGAAVADLDGDGYPDLIFGHHNQPFAELYFNNANGSFTKAPWHIYRDIHGVNPFRFSAYSPTMHFLVSPGGSGGAHPTSPVLFAVSSSRTIEDVTPRSGLTVKTALGRGRSAIFMSLRRHPGSIVDAVLTNAALPSLTPNHQKGFRGVKNGRFKQEYLKGFSHKRNPWGAVTDIDGDGRMELLSFHNLAMYRVRGRFRMHDITAQVFPADLPLDGTSAVAELDFDNDGRMDLYVARSSRGDLGWRHGRDHADYLFRNVGGRYEDVSRSSRIPLRSQSHGVTTGDFNNDGFIDLLLTRYRKHDLLLINRGDGTFRTQAAHLHRRRNVRGDMAVAVDYDRDGRLDLIVSEGDHHVRRLAGLYKVFRNLSKGSGNAILVRVMNAHGRRATSLHAVVRVFAGKLRMMRRVGSPGTAVSNSYIELVHFGIGTRRRVDRVSVTWVDGSVQNRYKVKAGELKVFGR